MSGFKKTLRDNVEVRVNDRMGLDLTMEIGGLEETVTVLAESPLLETRSASQGQVIDEKRISPLPLSDGNPFILARLAPGMAYTVDLSSAPVRQRRHRRWSPTGRRGDESTLDGSPTCTATAWRSCRRPTRCRSSRSRAPRSTRSRATRRATINVAIKSGTNSGRDRYFLHP